ncbi:MAG: sulfotransferase family protein [Candidatus Heimdallarchaeota archaeon]
MKSRALKVTEVPLTGTTWIHWWRLLWQNKFRISVRYIPRALFITLIVAISAPFRLYEKLKYDRKIKKTQITKPPVIILGHWRGGTTYLHMLLSRNKDFAYLSYLHTFMPWLFICGRKIFRGAVQRAMPKKRRMDDLNLVVDEPNEEEFGLASMTPYSIYNGTYFPRRRKHYNNYCTFEGIPEKAIRSWKKTYLYYLKKLTFQAEGRRLVLKNPPSTARIKLLLEMFPDAKFIHLHRNPFEIYPSTLKMHENMVPSFYLQHVDGSAEDYIIETYANIYRKFFEEKDLIPKENFYEIGYEDLLKHPQQIVEEIFKRFELEGYETSKDTIAEFIAAQETYKTNKHTLDPAVKERIKTEWKQYYEQWGYTDE